MPALVTKHIGEPMKRSTKTILQTTLGDLIEALYSETKTFLGNERGAAVVVAVILNDLMTKPDLRDHPGGRQLRRRKKVVVSNG
jgi:hypothetical protein